MVRGATLMIRGFSSGGMRGKDTVNTPSSIVASMDSTCDQKPAVVSDYMIRIYDANKRFRDSPGCWLEVQES